MGCADDQGHPLAATSLAFLSAEDMMTLETPFPDLAAMKLKSNYLGGSVALKLSMRQALSLRLLQQN